MQETPALQQARSSAFIAVTQGICQMLGSLSVGVIYTEYGFRMETPILLAIAVIVMMNSIYLVRVMRLTQSNQERKWINRHSAFNYGTKI